MIICMLLFTKYMNIEIIVSGFSYYVKVIVKSNRQNIILIVYKCKKKLTSVQYYFVKLCFLHNILNNIPNYIVLGFKNL